MFNAIIIKNTVVKRIRFVYIEKNHKGEKMSDWQVRVDHIFCPKREHEEGVYYCKYSAYNEKTDSYDQKREICNIKNCSKIVRL